MQSRREYEVGYKKPPQHTRFKPGQSGNRHGRPAGSKNLATIVREALDAKVVVSERVDRTLLCRSEVLVTPANACIGGGAIACSRPSQREDIWSILIRFRNSH